MSRAECSRGGRFERSELNAVQNWAGVVGGYKGVPCLGCQRVQVDLVIDLHAHTASPYCGIQACL